MVVELLYDVTPIYIANWPFMPQQAFTLHRGFKLRGGGEPVHSHEQAQLSFAAAGMIQVHVDNGRWLVPSHLGVWIPAGSLHRIEVLTDAELWMVHWEPSFATAWAPSMQLDRAFAFRITPLMRSLLGAAFLSPPAADKTELIVKLMLYELTETTDAPTFLPMPTSVLGQRIAHIACGDVRNQLRVDAIASRAATSVRTMSRIFLAETGLSFKVWRQRSRIVLAMDLLARGKSIAQVSSEVGFASTASFSCAFRQVTTITPTAFIDRSN